MKTFLGFMVGLFTGAFGIMFMLLSCDDAPELIEDVYNWTRK